MEVDDRIAGKRGCCWIADAATAAGQALRRDSVQRVLRRDGDDDRQGSREMVLPTHLELDAPADLDGRAGNRSAVGPHPRRRQVAMEAMLGRLETNDSPTRLAEDEPRRNGELVDERRQRMP